MINNILLTYINADNQATYGWFQDADEVNEFIEDNENDILEIQDCLDCTCATDLLEEY